MSEELTQQAFTAILQNLVDTGRAPHYTELAARLGVSVTEAREAQRAAVGAAMAAWFANDTDYISSFPPFSNLPTQYLIAVDGEQKWYGQ